MYTDTRWLVMALVSTTCLARQPHDLEPQATLSRQVNNSNVQDWLRTDVRRVVSNLQNMYSRPIAREGVNDLPLQIMERRPIPKHDNADGDCLKSERGTLRPYPTNNNCYERVYRTDNKRLWWSLWGEISGDFRYTFDFVLWDKYFPTRKENQFWYLMLYLKTLAKTIKNHEEIVSMPVYQNEKNKLDKQVGVLLDYSSRNEGEKSMMEKLSDISSTMALYQADMRMLDGKLNEVFASVAHVQAHKNMLHSKLSDLDLKTSLIKALIDKQQQNPSPPSPTLYRMPSMSGMSSISGMSGIPNARSPPSIGSPSLGSPSIGSPSLGSPSIGSPSLGSPSLGSSSLGSPRSLGSPPSLGQYPNFPEGMKQFPQG